MDTAGHACVVAAVGRALGVGGGAVRADPHVHGTAVDAAGVHPARRVAVYRHGGPVAGRKDGGCMVCARQEEGAHADGGLFRDDRHPDAAAFRRTAGFPDGALPARMGAAPYPACRVLGLVGGIAAWGQGCRAAYALIHLAPVLGGLFRTARPRSCRIRPVPYDREPSSPRAGHDPRGPAIPWRRAVHAHSVRRLRTAGRGCVVQPPVLFRGLGYRGGLRAQGCPASALDVSPPAGFLWAHAGSPRRPPVVRRSDRGRRCARFGAGPAAPARCGAVEPPVRFRLLLPCRMSARAGGELARQDRAVAHPADRCLYALPRLYPRLPIRCADS